VYKYDTDVLRYDTVLYFKTDRQTVSLI